MLQQASIVDEPTAASVDLQSHCLSTWTTATPLATHTLNEQPRRWWRRKLSFLSTTVPLPPAKLACSTAVWSVAPPPSGDACQRRERAPTTRTSSPSPRLTTSPPPSPLTYSSNPPVGPSPAVTARLLSPASACFLATGTSPRAPTASERPQHATARVSTLWSPSWTLSWGRTCACR